jgi:hypothetical protein
LKLDVTCDDSLHRVGAKLAHPLCDDNPIAPKVKRLAQSVRQPFFPVGALLAQEVVTTNKNAHHPERTRSGRSARQKGMSDDVSEPG